jgi:putative FmdB family regulatory protein
MPVYLYRCLSCKTRFERTQLFSEKPLTRCPECHLNTVWRIPQLPAIIFKGSGWYSTDHHSPPDQKTSPMIKKSNQAENTSSKAGKL